MASNSLNFTPKYRYLTDMLALDRDREIARLWFSQPLTVSQDTFAKELGVSRHYVNVALESNYAQAHSHLREPQRAKYAH